MRPHTSVPNFMQVHYQGVSLLSWIGKEGRGKKKAGAGGAVSSIWRVKNVKQL